MGSGGGRGKISVFENTAGVISRFGTHRPQLGLYSGHVITKYVRIVIFHDSGNVFSNVCKHVFGVHTRIRAGKLQGQEINVCMVLGKQFFPKKFVVPGLLEHPSDF